ncbi:MAG: DUF2796 domain-containing protein [Rheinheimera sp.]|nr:DUF2796 domain-containing protein [Rheinheimera sp.]
MRCHTVIPLLAVFSIPVAGAAAEPVQSGSHGAHVHGQAQLSFATEAQQVELLLESPVANLVGFEHAPESAAEKAAWQHSQTLLQSGQWLQLPAEANCQLQQQQLNEPWPQSPDPHHHADVELSLTYHCSAPAALTEVRLELFRHAADLHQVDVQWVSAQQQGAVTLTPQQRVFRLTPAN